MRSSGPYGGVADFANALDDAEPEEREALIRAHAGRGWGDSPPRRRSRGHTVTGDDRDEAAPPVPRTEATVVVDASLPGPRDPSREAGRVEEGLSAQERSLLVHGQPVPR
ncbi:hypothetical protein HEP85_40980 [Streptomyces sp. RPA4-2]|uniref:hypothetical protein n=1 Tax=Streptomyces sp. RPA4-2 TaxID=2721244 RepID=UPI00143E67AB|nr:hypothetical protein [Streptomyces sp. RPA4-2]QIY66673.1 hypothetical protein HEP85_40980 [Streptomyces sp. RPA4-2]